MWQRRVMTVAFRTPTMTRAEFFAWLEGREGRWEFNGFEPVRIDGEINAHNQVCQNIYAAMRARLRGGPCRVMGRDAGVAIQRDGVRYPDALVTCTPPPAAGLVVPDVIAVFEATSPSSGRVDRIDKLRDYRGVPSIRHYAILEHTSAALTLLSRPNGIAAWTAVPSSAIDTLEIPELGLTIPVSEFYEDAELPDAAASQP